MRKVRKAEEGAAAAELALATMLLVPMALYSMYVGEAFIAAIKAQEAEISAAWEITAYRLHNFGSGANYRSLYSQAANGAARRLETDLQDFDSFDTSNRSGRINAVSEYELTGVRCELRSGGGAGSNMGPGLGLGGGYLHSDGWVGCQADVEFRNRFLPRRIHSEFMRTDLIPSDIATLQMCGMGNTPQGCRASRTRGMLVLTDDWGLEDPKKNPLGSQGRNRNIGYFNVGKSIYEVFGMAYVSGTLAVLGGFTPMVYAMDQGSTTSFRLAYSQRISDQQSVSTASGSFTAHVSPHCDYDDSRIEPYTHRIRNMSAEVYRERDTGNYLGKQQADWNLQ
jgi:hypothetical protein